MSKKMMKRSLALGALMAFVITGSAWAEEYVYDGNIITTVDVNIGNSSTNTVVNGYVDTEESCTVTIDGYKTTINGGIYAYSTYGGDTINVKGNDIIIKNDIYVWNYNHVNTNDSVLNLGEENRTD